MTGNQDVLVNYLTVVLLAFVLDHSRSSLEQNQFFFKRLLLPLSSSLSRTLSQQMLSYQLFSLFICHPESRVNTALTGNSQLRRKIHITWPPNPVPHHVPQPILISRNSIQISVFISRRVSQNGQPNLLYRLSHSQFFNQSVNCIRPGSV